MRAFSAALAAAIAFGSLSALAQGNPSADAIINALKPTGTLQSSTRGIRPSAPAAPVTAVSPVAMPAGNVAMRPVALSVAVTAPVVTAQVAAPSVNLTVQFITGSAELTPDATRTLDELGRALSSATLAAFRFRIEGHTDTIGTGDANLALSQLRAGKVADYLEKKFAVSAARLESVGRGSQAPLIRTADQVAEPRNRRVQVINLGS